MSSPRLGTPSPICCSQHGQCSGMMGIVVQWHWEAPQVPCSWCNPTPCSGGPCSLKYQWHPVQCQSSPTPHAPFQTIVVAPPRLGTQCTKLVMLPKTLLCPLLDAGNKKRPAGSGQSRCLLEDHKQDLSWTALSPLAIPSFFYFLCYCIVSKSVYYGIRRNKTQHVRNKRSN